MELFRKADGYLHSELGRDCSDPLRYTTIDHWASKAHWDEFRASFAAGFDRLDRQCESLTKTEREIGRFELA